MKPYESKTGKKQFKLQKKKEFYYVARNNDSGELHLYDYTNPEKAEKLSACGRIPDTDTSSVRERADENDVRDYCAKEGRKVCGQCVAHLYFTKFVPKL